MIEKSVFTNKTIISELNKNYNIDITKIENEDRGSANIFYVYDNKNNKYVLKEFESKCDENKILKEANIIEHLKNKKINVPEYIKTVNKKFYFKYENKIIILMKFINGYSKNSNTGTFEQTMESANLLGKVVNALEDFETLEKMDITKWYEKDQFEKSKLKYKELISKLGNSDIDKKIYIDLKYKLELIKKVENIDLKNLKKLTFKNTHGDFSIMQFIYDNEKVKAILDFERAKYMPISWEIIRSYTHIDEKCKDGSFNIENFVKYVQEVMKYVDLNEYDLKYMPYMYLLRLSTSPYGYEEYMKNNELKSLLNFGFWRAKMCKSLYENLEEISDKLLSIKIK